MAQRGSLLNDVAQKEESISLIADGVENVNIQRTNNYSNKEKRFSQFQSHIASSYLEIKVEPQNQLHPQETEQFKDENKTYYNAFKENFQVYNSKSGNVKFDVNFGPTLPPPTKRHLPVYNSDNLCLLQEKFHELESLGVLVRPEDLGVTVVGMHQPNFSCQKAKRRTSSCNRFC